MNEEHEREGIRRALAGKHREGRYLLELCAKGLTMRRLSPVLSDYRADRLRGVLKALDEADALRAAKPSSGSVRSSRDAGIAEALLLQRPAGRPRDPFPSWEEPLAALGAILAKRGRKPEQCNAALDTARQLLGGKSLERSEAQRILSTYAAMRDLPNSDLLRLLGGLRDKLPTILRQTSTL